MLRVGTDPLGKGIDLMLQRGAISALFLALSAPPIGSPVPLFVSTATVLPQDRLSIWTGLKWDPRVVPEMWNFYIRSGYVELPPPGANTHQNSHRNIVRLAFGITHPEWLLLVQVGPSHQSRGVVAFVSHQSLLPSLSEAKPFLSAPLPKNS